MDENLVLPDAPTGITETSAQDGRKGGVTAIYDAAGLRLDRMQRGLNIIRYGDGSTRKVWMR